MKVAAYLRVSTDRQAEHGLGLAVQRDAITRWATTQRHSIVTWAADEGVSGSNGLDTRVGLFDALSAVQDGSANGLVVYRLDRLARDLILQETLIGMVQKAGGRVYSTAASEDDLLSVESDDPSRKMIRQILGAVSEYERAMIRLRLRSGKLAKKQRGGFVGGRVPLGYERDGAGSLRTDQAEQDAIARMVALRAQGMSLRDIAAALTAEGYKPKRGEQWHSAVIGRVLARHDQSA